MRPREVLFGAVALSLVLLYAAVGARLGPLMVPAGTPTPAPTKPVTVEAPQVAGKIAFALRGDVYVLSQGRYVALTVEGRSQQPTLSPDGKFLVFARVESIDGKRDVDGQVVPALLRFTDIVRKDSSGGPETVIVSGLRARSPSGFHQVAWMDGPALSPDSRRVAVVTDNGDGASDLELYDVETHRRVALLSQGANLADPSWSPDGKTIVVTSYTLGTPRLLQVTTDGRAATQVKLSVDGEPYRAAYSLDGEWLVYTLRHDAVRNDVHAVELSTGRDVALTSDGKSWNGVFAPDGRQIAFLREASGVIDLYAMDFADALTGGVPRAAMKLTRGEGVDGDSRPFWAR